MNFIALRIFCIGFFQIIQSIKKYLSRPNKIVNSVCRETICYSFLFFLMSLKNRLTFLVNNYYRFQYKFHVDKNNNNNNQKMHQVIVICYFSAFFMLINWATFVSPSEDILSPS